MRTFCTLTVCLAVLLLTGCVSITNRVTPEDLSVKPMAEGKTCMYTLFELGYGTNTVEQAMANATPPIQKIRSVSTSLFFLLFVNKSCLIVVGEGAPASAPYRRRQRRRSVDDYRVLEGLYDASTDLLHLLADGPTPLRLHKSLNSPDPGGSLGQTDFSGQGLHVRGVWVWLRQDDR